MSAIRFAVKVGSLGVVLVAATDQGVCAVLLGDDALELEQDLARRFPRAALVRADEELASLIDRVVALVDDPRRDEELPLDLRGTAFQQTVWQALRRVPVGTTVTYTELAEAIGLASTSVRAVAGACAANAIAVAVPCHRVVRADGSLSGYRWGVERKRVLLAREGVVIRGASGGTGVLPGF